MTACTGHGGGTDPSTPPAGHPSAQPVVDALATGLRTGTLAPVAFTVPAAVAQADLDVITGGMDGLKPSTITSSVSYPSDSSAQAVLQQTYLVGAQKWSFSTTAALQYDGSAWKVVWNPAIVEPHLSESTRLRHVRTLPKRASILGAGNKPIASEQAVYRVGIDKSVAKTAAQAAAQAKQLAPLLKIDAARYQKAVAAAGAKAFVVAETLRPDDVPDIDKITAARAVETNAMLAQTATFADSVLGVMGAPTAAEVTASHGDLTADDEVGLSGLEKRYEAQLRGTPGQVIQVVQGSAPGTAVASAPASAGSPAASAGGSASPTASATPGSVLQTLFTVKAVPGKPLVTGIDATLQAKAESVLSSVNQVAAIVVLDRSTGLIRAAAVSPATNAVPDATVGAFAPGSTFKAVTALALLRKGYTASSQVSCPATVTVNGKVFKNYAEFPSSRVGTMTLAQAFALSCNTAFISQAAKLSAADLADAAASLGFGVDFQSGFASFYGSVPATADVVTKAADMIGQGQVTASPMSMAGVAASVAAGHTVVPYLITGVKPTPKATLTAAEAGQLRTLMQAVISSGTGTSLKGVLTGAKTGTAEYGTDTPLKTHAWMIGYTGQYAVAALVNDGASGAGTAGPLLKALLS